MKTSYLALLSLFFLVSCNSDFKRIEVETENLSGFIDAGNSLGVYGDAQLKITKDSIQMTNWPVTRLTESLKNVMDTVIATQGGATDMYTIQIANKGQLDQRVFVDSLIHVLSKNGLIN